MRENSLNIRQTSEIQKERLYFLRNLTVPSLFMKQRIAFSFLLIIFVLLFLISLGMGAVEVSPTQTLAILVKHIGLELPFTFTAQQESVLLFIRLPRIVLGLTIGAGLAVCGGVLQSIFRNPLADPALIGTSSGAALTASISIVLGETLSRKFGFFEFQKLYFLPIAAFLGGLTATLFIYKISRKKTGTNVATMLLAGIAVNALAGAGIGLMNFLATDAQLRNISFWSMGSLSGATWKIITVTVPLVAVATFLLLRLSRSLNLLLLGEAEARHLGVNTERLKWKAIMLVALTIGAAVSVAGIIGFIGLVVPHLLRLIIGADNRYLLPCSALLGANLMLVSDLVARSLVAPAELPIGIVTALIGAPFFVWLLLRKDV